MKTLNLLLLSAVCCAFLSCSDDDSQSNTTKSYAGTYKISAVVLSGTVDFNQDGVASSNLMTETDCYNNSTIVLKDDKTFVSSYNFVGIGTEVTCDNEVTSGTWEVQGNQLVLTNTIMDPPLVTNITIQENILVNSLNNALYPDRDAEGNAVYSTGPVTINYTKQ